jgi:hypothetical protein
MAFTPAQMLEVLKRTCDEGWLTPLLEDPDSAAILQAIAEIGSRMSYSSDHVCETGLLSTAPPGRPGSSIPTGAAQTVPGLPLPSTPTLAAGLTFVDARNVLYTLGQTIAVPGIGIDFSFSVNTFRQTELVDTVDDPIIRFAPSYLVGGATNATPIVITTTTINQYVNSEVVYIEDVLGNTAANGVWQITIIDNQKFSLNLSVGNGDYTGEGKVSRAPQGVVISSSTPTRGGASDYLTLAAAERTIKRQPFESDSSFRARAVSIPDSVSPVGILEAINGVAQQNDLPQMFLFELFNDLASPTLKADLGMGFIDSLYLDTKYDLVTDTAYAGPFAWDELISTFGAAEKCYFQIRPTGDIASFIVSSGFWDAAFWDDYVYFYYDSLASTSLLPGTNAILEEVNRKKAACSDWDFILPGVEEFYASGLRLVGSLAGLQLAFTAAPPAGFAWDIWESWVGHVRITNSTTGPTWSHQLKFTFSDAFVGTTTQYFGKDTERFSEQRIKDLFGGRYLVTKIEGYTDIGVPQVDTNLIMALRVLQVSLV